ncbi:MAG: TonB-dependent receptor [Gammaproteobacteria bacterium]|nr:MAG: TonB-dependent receptor [Gammaproteobacteria bacterium]
MKNSNRNTLKHSLLAIAVGTSLTLMGVNSAYAAQSGAIKGKITAAAGTSLAGVMVTATSAVMPKPRTAVTRADGSYNLPLLLPGTYQLTFTAKDGSVTKKRIEVLLDQTSNLSFVLQPQQNDIEVITITGGGVIIPEGDSSLTSSVGAKVVDSVPIGDDYRDLMKLIPGVQYSENTVIGPSGGGSGRDNKYGFDGVNVSLPMFGTLASEPSTHDIQSVSMDRGGAKAVGFNRSGGFAINTISKSGTNEFHGSLEYKIQPKSFVNDKKDTDNTKFELDKTWITASVSGPLIKDELFFYGSFYRPEVKKQNKETAYGPAKDYKSTREEYYGKLTWAPTEDLLLNASIRTSDKEGKGLSVGAFDADSTSAGSIANQDIYIIDGSYIINDVTTIDFQYSEFKLETVAGPDTLFSNVVPAIGASLDLSNLDQLGLFHVPNTNDDPGYDNGAAQVLIDQYGYIDVNGNRAGGGAIGGDSTLNEQNFYRDSFEISLDHEMDVGDSVHYLHFGYKWQEGTEELSRLSNGWGSIGFVGGAVVEDFDNGGVPVYYATSTQQMSFLDESGNKVLPIVSTTEMFNFEINDTIEWQDFTFNVGVLVSKDVLYGQGLKANSSNVSGYELAPGNKYKMHTTEWKDLIQPRLGVSWQYKEDSTVFANFASYNPEATSLARAASWARNTRRTLNVYFDQTGNYIGNTEARGSSGKFFQKGIKPRRIDEFTIGTTKSVTDELYVRAHARYRKGQHFWEDTWNGSRGYGKYKSPFGGVPDDIAAKGLYIPELQSYRDEVGGSSYVIAELDGGFTKYYELNVEATYQTERFYLNASYAYSHYYGNFDQDNVSGTVDANRFIGSSLLADGRGRQLWDGKYGRLLGDKPHIFKAYGYYTTDWEANIGAYLLMQSGDVWEKWDGSVYGYSSDTIRYAEHAGNRRSPMHWQVDLNYTQDYKISDNYTLKFRADLFNVFDRQTGYSYNPYVDSTTFGEPRRLFNPRRLQLSAKIEF